LEGGQEKSKILVVDDEKAVRDFLSTLFKGAGYICYTSPGGTGAIEKASETLPDLIFLDFFLAGLSGIEICKRLKSNPQTSSIPVIIFTGILDYNLKIKCLEAGASDFMTKPLNPIEINIKTRNFLRLKEYAATRARNALLRETLWKIEQAKKEWEQTVDCINDIIILIDQNDTILRINKKLSDITNLHYRDLLGRKWQDVLRETGFTHMIHETGDINFYYPDNRCFNYTIYSRSVVENAGRKSVIILQDITEIIQLTRELENNRDVLENKNLQLEKAYSDLKSAQSQILQQEKMASIGQLAAGVAHEINNPTGFVMSNLNTLLKYIERIKEFISCQTETLSVLTKDFQGKSEYIERLNEKRKTTKYDYVMADIDSLINESIEGTERIKRIVQDLKSFSRVDEAEYKPADINEGIESTMNIIWNELKYKATVKKELGDIPRTKCNAGQLNQVFMNILINAAQAIEQQGEISISTRHEDSNIYITISDTGCGVPEDKINRIFEPFFTTKEVGQGTGLGLSIAYDIIRKHNGDIRVDSKPGGGTTFTIKIPVID
jgi:two-component system NtrC family sensor kinase